MLLAFALENCVRYGFRYFVFITMGVMMIHNMMRALYVGAVELLTGYVIDCTPQRY